MTIRAFGNFEIKKEKTTQLTYGNSLYRCMAKFLPRMNQSVLSDLLEDYIVTIVVEIHTSTCKYM